MSSDFEIFSECEDKSWCEAWPEGASSGDKSKTAVMFSILIDVWLDTYHGPNLLAMTRYHRKRFRWESDRLVNSEFPLRSWITVESMLSSVQVVHKPSMVHKILTCAREMAANPMYAGYKVLRMNVTITIDQYEDGVSESPRSMVPAKTKSMKKGLKIVKVEKSMSIKDEDPCPICWEEISFGSHVARLPACSHRFHGYCIIYWLNKSRLCPLCRCLFE